MSGDNSHTADAALLARSVERIEILLDALELSPDRKSREAAREIVELLLDLHGLAFARIGATLSADEDGQAMFRKLAANPHVGAMLLLHGLHPQELGQRLHAAIQSAPWRERGVEVELLGVDTSSARLRIKCALDAEGMQALKQEIEAALIEAAPDLDEIQIEVASGATAAA